MVAMLSNLNSKIDLNVSHFADTLCVSDDEIFNKKQTTGSNDQFNIISLNKISFSFF